MIKWGISILVVVAAIYGAVQLFFYYDRVKAEGEAELKKQEAAQYFSPEQLPGVPQQLENSLKAAQQKGAVGLGNWLKMYGRSIQDPRKAWIELDYCIALSRENPAEARRVFAEVKNRTPDSSPVWKRIKDLEKAYE